VAGGEKHCAGVSRIAAAARTAGLMIAIVVSTKERQKSEREHKGKRHVEDLMSELKILPLGINYKIP
jgi:hypothetical protein